MDQRMPLNSGTLLSIQTTAGIIEYTIVKELGRGASCIVYEARETMNNGEEKILRLKEFYPYDIKIDRAKGNILVPDTMKRHQFDEERIKFEEEFKVINRLFYSEKMFSYIVNPINIYPNVNGTTYLAYAYSSNKTLEDYKPKTLKKCISIVKQVAYLVDALHKQGYLYLDIKPDNILIIEAEDEKVQLFDFDSLIPMSINKELLTSDRIFRISYTRGFAPVELQMSKISEIGPQTDVYEIGALLYYLLFGCTPSRMDCSELNPLSFEKTIVESKDVENTLFKQLAVFLKRALSACYKSRFTTMSEVYDELCELERQADPLIPHVISTALIPPKYLIGREKELHDLSELINNPQGNCILVTGMGGIGKSTLVKRFLSNQKDNIDVILYLQYAGSIVRAITDDSEVHVVGIKREDAENLGDYYKRKCEYIREVIQNKSALVVLDNFSGEVDDEFIRFQNIGWKIILVTRQAPKNHPYVELMVGELKNIEDLKMIFEENAHQKIRTNELPLFNTLVEKIKGHTLILELIAKQIYNSYLSLSKAVYLMEEKGFSRIAPETVEYEKDLQIYEETLGNILDALFETSNLDESNKVILKSLSVFGDSGISVPLFCRIMSLKSKDGINKLVNDGWVERYDAGDIIKIKFHPVIKEAIRRWELTEKYKKKINDILFFLYSELWIESTKNNYPRLLYKGMIGMEKLESINNPMFSKWLKRYRAKKETKAPSKLAFELFDKRRHNIDDRPALKGKIIHLLDISCEILTEKNYDETIKEMETYNLLLLQTVITQMRYQNYYDEEEMNGFIQEIDNAIAEVVNGYKQANVADIRIVLELTSIIVSWYLSIEQINEACQSLNRIWPLITYFRKKEFYALYFFIESEILDTELNGEYDSTDQKYYEIKKELLSTLDKAERYAKSGRKTDVKHIYECCILSKATILSRSSSIELKEMEALLKRAEKSIEETTLPYADVRRDYYMVMAWYYSLNLQDIQKTEEFVKKAVDLSVKIVPNDLILIETTLQPVANIFYELGEYNIACIYLKLCQEICASHSDAIVYKNKERDLNKYLEEVREVQQQSRG